MRVFVNTEITMTFKDKFVPTSFKQPKTVASVTAAFQKAINDLLQIEQDNNAAYDNAEKQIMQIEADNEARLTEAKRAASVRVKLEGLLS